MNWKKIMFNISPCKSTGADDIGPRFIRDATPSIKEPLCYLINLSLNCGKFPDALKLARVTPVHKSGSKLDTGNYRPISILPTFSKIFEKIVHNQISTYLNDNNLVYKNQSGFRESYSTDTALTFLNNRILDNMDKGLYSGAIVIDLKKAFDTVNHTILLDKIKALGACPMVYNWLFSYLDKREQFVKIGDASSPCLNLLCGVP